MDLTPNIVAVMVSVAVEVPYTYRVPYGMTVTRGSIVAVPLGVTTTLGVVWGPPKDNYAHNRLKDIVHAYDCPPLSDELLKLVDWVSRYTLAPPGLVLRSVLRSTEALEPERNVTAYRATGSEPGRMTPHRQRVLETVGDTVWTKTALVGESGISPSVIEGLWKSGALEKLDIPAPPIVLPPDPEFAVPTLSEGQQKALDQLRARGDGFSVALLDGVTGSGKTEVFFESVADTLRAGKQALILLPEIALTHTFLERFERRFGTKPGEWHSDMTPAQRTRTWRGVMNGTVRALVGARSALFLPFHELGLIVLDEEHDGAFKQTEGGANYHARDMAVVRAQLAGARAILASATPSVETRHNANSGKYAHIRLESRFANAQLPDITAIDMREDPPDRGQWIAPQLSREIFATIDRGEQALLFLNRRGYAPLTLCKACGHQYQCPNCDAWLVEHRFRGVLMCHHCGHEQRMPKDCSECGAVDSLTPIGPGIERVAEEAEARFPDARKVILSSDMGSNAQLRERFAAIERGEYDLIIGTQLVAKGHHFEKLTLVGVLDADLGLAHGDPRASERTFQILTQVTGRAGRAGKAGRAFLQTYHPDHAVMQAMVKGDREAFYAHELKVRQKGGLPPYGRLAALIVSANEHDDAMRFAKGLLAEAPMAEHLRLFGPADAPIAMVRGRYRVRLLAQSPKDFNLSDYIRFWLANAEQPKGNVKVQVDIDPQSFF